MKLLVASVRPLLRAFCAAPEHRINMINPALKPEVVLSEDNRQACVEKLRSYQLPKVYGEDIPKAAVLVPLCLYKGELGLLYTLRSMKLMVNRGQVSFPGGKWDKDDADLTETALRETWEELKIPKEKVDVWTTGCLIGKKDVNVMPVLGYIGEVVPENLKINHDEVEEVFVVSLQKLCDPALRRYTRFYNGFTLPTYLGGKYRVWGFTGVITSIILESLVPEVYKDEFLKVQSMHKNRFKENESRKTSVKKNATRSQL